MEINAVQGSDNTGSSISSAPVQNGNGFKNLLALLLNMNGSSDVQNLTQQNGNVSIQLDANTLNQLLAAGDGNLKLISSDILKKLNLDPGMSKLTSLFQTGNEITNITGSAQNPLGSDVSPPIMDLKLIALSFANGVVDKYITDDTVKSNSNTQVLSGKLLSHVKAEDLDNFLSDNNIKLDGKSKNALMMMINLALSCLAGNITSGQFLQINNFPSASFSKTNETSLKNNSDVALPELHFNNTEEMKEHLVSLINQKLNELSKNTEFCEAVNSILKDDSANFDSIIKKIIRADNAAELNNNITIANIKDSMVQNAVDNKIALSDSKTEQKNSSIQAEKIIDTNRNNETKNALTDSSLQNTSNKKDDVKNEAVNNASSEVNTIKKIVTNSTNSNSSSNPSKQNDEKSNSNSSNTRSVETSFYDTSESDSKSQSDPKVGMVLEHNSNVIRSNNIDANPEVVQVARPEDIAELVVRKFKSLKMPDITELKVKLKPNDLGEVTIKLTLEKGMINGTITAEKREVYNMLQNQIDIIKSDMKNNNINLNNISVNIGSGDSDSNSHSRNFSGNEKRENRNFNAFVKEVDEKDSEDGFNIIA